LYVKLFESCALLSAPITGGVKGRFQELGLFEEEMLHLYCEFDDPQAHAAKEKDDAPFTPRQGGDVEEWSESRDGDDHNLYKG
jgi:hypothetical protein